MTEQKLPAHTVAEGLELAKGCTYFGIPLSDLSHDELLAVAALAYKDVAEVRSSLFSTHKMYQSINKAREARRF